MGEEEKRSYLRQLKRFRAQLTGHILRHDELMKRVIEGKTAKRNHKIRRRKRRN